MMLLYLPYSSGTTGLSKGVMLTHRNCVANLIQTTAVLAVDEGNAAVSAVFSYLRHAGFDEQRSGAGRQGSHHA